MNQNRVNACPIRKWGVREERKIKKAKSLPEKSVPSLQLTPQSVSSFYCIKTFDCRYHNLKKKKGVFKWQLDEIMGLTIEWKLLSLSPD
jgi:hypothetical protein